MGINPAPGPQYVQELQFKKSSIHQVSEHFSSIPISCNLVTADGKRGLLYVGHQNKITVLKLENEANIEWKIDLDLPDLISKISLSCDSSYLAVTLSAPAVLIYSAASLSKNALELLHEIRLSTSSGDIYVFDLGWNPAIPGMLCTVASDHTIGSFHVKGDRKAGVGITAIERIEGIEALCLAWSPKGKQIVVGCKNGNIIQLKPELKLARKIPGPEPNMGGVIAILWISNFQFCAAYQEPVEQRVNVLIVDAPKGETLARFTNYEDITYGGIPTTRYYFDYIPEWGVIFAASNTSAEIAVLGTIDNGITWQSWQLVDSGRAELPLLRTDESFPVGFAIDKSSNRKLQWGPETTLPNPVPVLHILGTSGQLCSFHIVNLKPNCPGICSPPSEVVTAPQIQAAFPAPRPSIAPNEISFNLATGATSTPRPKIESPKEKPKNVMMTNFFADSAKSSSFARKVDTVNPPPMNPPPMNPPTVNLPPANPPPMNLPPVNLPPANLPPTNLPPAPLPHIETKVTAFAQQPEPKPPNFVPPVEIKIPKPRIEKIETQAKLEVKLPKEIVAKEPHQEKPNIDDGLCLRAYREEQANFEKELKSRLEFVTWECGTNSEREQLVEKTALIDEFLRDLQETTTSLSSDIAYLKALLLQSFAWLEETNSKNSEGLKLSSRSRRENSKLAELQRFFYYTQSQLVQASKVLDLQWSDQQSKEQKKMKIPSMECIYQSLIDHGQIIAKEKSNIENMVRKWKSIARGGTVSGLNRSLSNLHITSSNSSNFGKDSAIDLRCKAIANKTQSFSREKQMKLRDLLSGSAPRIIKAAKPTLIQDRLEATLSSLASLSPGKTLKPKPEQKLTPVQKPKVQSPLTSLNNIVSKIGTPTEKLTAKEINPQLKTPISTSVPAFATKNIPALSISPLASQKPKQAINISFAQGSQNSQNLVKPFPKMDSISFGQKTEEKNLPKEVKTDNEKESALLSGKSLTEISTSQPTGIIIPGNNQGSIIGSNIISTTQPVQSTFSLQPPVPPVSLATSAAAQSFSFASKPATNLPAFSFPSSKPEDKSNLELGALNLNKSGITITSIPEPKAVTGSQVTAAMSTINFGKDLTTPTIFGQASPGTTAFGTSGNNAFGKTPGTTAFGNNSGSMFGKSGMQGSIFGGSASFGVSSTGSPSSGVSAPSGIFASSSISPGGIPALSSITMASSTSVSSSAPVFSSTISSSSTTAPASVPVPVPSSVIVSKPTSISSPILAASLAQVPSPISIPSPVPVSSPPPAYGSTNIPPISSPTTTSSPDLLPLSLGSPKPTTTVAPLTSVTPQASTTSSSIFSTPPFGGISSAVSTLNFGAATAISSSPLITPVFGEGSTSTSGSIFGGGSMNSTGNSVFGGTVATPSSNPFGGNTLTQSPSSTSIFGSTPTTTGNSIFGGGSTAGGGAAFGMNTAPATTASVFGMSSQTPVFGTSTGTSFFGGNTAKPQETSFSMFGGSAVTTGTNSAFGQSPAFGTKPAFGGSPDFGQAKPAFGGGFGTAAFGSNQMPAGFGSPPIMGGSPPPLGGNPMQKVFGVSSGSNTFESLATQGGGLSFSSLAQSSPEQQQQQQQQQQQKPPEFAAKSSFSSWR